MESNYWMGQSMLRSIGQFLFFDRLRLLSIFLMILPDLVIRLSALCSRHPPRVSMTEFCLNCLPPFSYIMAWLGSRLNIYRPHRKILVVVDRKKEKVSSISW
jgi:hypothetical protein